MTKRVYISGKIGEEVISEATRRKFAKAAKMLKAKGYDAFDPTDQDWQKVLRITFSYDKEKQPHGEKVDFYAYTLLRDMMVLATCDAIYMLEDWEDSPGARTEYFFARACGKRIIIGNEQNEE